MRILGKCGTEKLAIVYLAELDGKRYIEFVESITPPLTKKEKWVLIISTMAGCPVLCKFCDAGGRYYGKLQTDEMIEQIDYLVSKSFPSGVIETEKFKIQFARMGEPSLNPAVLDVLEMLPVKYKVPGLLPSLSTIAPKSGDNFFIVLKEIKDKLYGYNFQLQFSIHSTNRKQRDWLIPIKKWSFEEIANFGKYFYSSGDRKIALNFAVNRESIVEPSVIEKYFPPDIFMIKITPINPTVRSLISQLDTQYIPKAENLIYIEKLRNSGYQVILNIGELEENNIGSNCGQLLSQFLRSGMKPKNSYTYKFEKQF